MSNCVALSTSSPGRRKFRTSALFFLALVAFPIESALAQSAFVLRADALASVGGSAAAGSCVLGMTVGQGWIGESFGGGQLEYAGFWRPGITSLLAVEPDLPGTVPARFELTPVFPNPSRGQVGFRLGIPAAGSGAPLRFQISDITGRRVAERLVPSGPGWHWISWDGRDAAGSPAGPGVYFCRIDAGGFVASRRFVLLH